MGVGIVNNQPVSTTVERNIEAGVALEAEQRIRALQEARSGQRLAPSILAGATLARRLDATLMTGSARPTGVTGISEDGVDQPRRDGRTELLNFDEGPYKGAITLDEQGEVRVQGQSPSVTYEVGGDGVNVRRRPTTFEASGMTKDELNEVEKEFAGLSAAQAGAKIGFDPGDYSAPATNRGYQETVIGAFGLLENGGGPIPLVGKNGQDIPPETIRRWRSEYEASVQPGTANHDAIFGPQSDNGTWIDRIGKKDITGEDVANAAYETATRKTEEQIAAFLLEKSLTDPSVNAQATANAIFGDRERGIPPDAAARPLVENALRNNPEARAGIRSALDQNPAINRRTRRELERLAPAQAPAPRPSTATAIAAAQPQPAARASVPGEDEGLVAVRNTSDRDTLDVWAGAYGNQTVLDATGRPIMNGNAGVVGAGINARQRIAGGELDIGDARNNFGATVGASLDAEARAQAYVAGSFDPRNGDAMVAGSNEVFAGVMARGNAELGARYAGATANIGAGVGVGYGVEGHLGMEDGRLEIGGNLKLGFGPAVEVGGSLQLDVGQVFSDLGSGANAVMNGIRNGASGLPHINLSPGRGTVGG